MKRLFFCGLIVVAALLLPSEIQAQRGLKIGGFVMPQYSTLFNQDQLDMDEDAFIREPLYGIAGGMILGYNPGQNFGLRLNVIYSQQGGRYSARNTFLERINYTTRLKYVKIPFMMGFHSNWENRKTSFYCYGGFQVGLLTRGYAYDDDKRYQPPLPDYITRYPTVWESYKTLNYSAVGDVGFDIKMTQELAMNLHLRGDYSIQDAANRNVMYRETLGGVTTEIPYWDEGNGTTHNITLGLMLGVTYTFIREKAVPVEVPAEGPSTAPASVVPEE